MGININKIEKVLIKDIHLNRIISDYLVLRDKLNNPKSQSWYSKKGIEITLLNWFNRQRSSLKYFIV